MINGKAFIVLFLTASVFACNNERVTVTERVPINFTIQYNFDANDIGSKDNYRQKFDGNKLYLFIEEGFENDTLEVFVNGIINTVITVKTELSTGLAKVIELDNISSINSIGFRVNNSPLISFEIFNKKMNLIGIEKKKNDIEIVFYKRIPVFY